MEAVLGDNISREQGADGGPDADGINNILRNPAGAVTDTADHDRADDGWRNRNVPILHCQRTSLVVRVHKASGAQLDRMVSVTNYSPPWTEPKWWGKNTRNRLKSAQNGAETSIWGNF
jgi:hypothetical protein